MALPNRAFLKASEAAWKRRHTYRQRKVNHYTERTSHWYQHWMTLRDRPEGDPHRVAAWQDYDRFRELRDKWVDLRDEASEKLALRRKQLARYGGDKPKIVTAKQQGLSFVNRFGQLGLERNATVHHTAGPTDGSDSRAVGLNQSYHRAHANKGWGGIGYGWNIARSGTIFCLRPTVLKGAHVGGHNTSNVGVMFHGTTGDKPTQAQRDSLRWLLASAHTNAMPSAHRTDLDLRRARIWGHRDWSGHTSNACPGTHYELVRIRA